MKTYEAGAFHEDFEGGKAMGKLKVHLNSLEFTSEEYPDEFVKIPLKDLVLKRGGASERLIFIEHPMHTDYTFYTNDPTFLDDLNLNSDSEIANKIKVLKSKKNKALMLSFAALGVMAFLFFGLLSAKGPLVNMVTRNVPIEFEQRVGELILNQYLTVNGRKSNGDIDWHLDKLTQKLTSKIELGGYEPKFFISSSSELNAFALPGGYIVLNKGFIEAADRPEEVLGVVAHELAHVTQRHVLINIVSGLSTYAIFSLFIGDYSGIIAVLADQGQFLLSQKFSRDAEREADTVAYDYLLRANIDPSGLRDFLIRIDKKNKELAGETLNKAEKALTIFSTHPATSERIEEIEANLKILEADKRVFPAVDYDLNKLKDLL